MPYPKAILLVEDDPATREELTALVESLGIRCIAAEGNQQAIATFRKEGPFDAVILDIELPSGSGLGLASILKEESGATAPPDFLFVTGHPSLDRSIEALRIGAIDFIRKPIDPEKFMASLARCRGERGSGQPFQVTAPGRAPAPSHLHATKPGGEDNDTPLALIERLGKLRSARIGMETAMGSGDSTTALLIEILKAEMKDQPIDVTGLAISSSMPQTTALRRIDSLSSRNLIIKITAENDRRRILIQLTDQGRQMAYRYLQEAEKAITGTPRHGQTAGLTAPLIPR